VLREINNLKGEAVITILSAPHFHNDAEASHVQASSNSALVVGAVLGFLSTTAYAGPCTAQIAEFEAAIRQSSGNPLAGLTAPQSVAAQLDRQPTPESVKQANERLKSQFDATMAGAKRLDAQGNRSGCTRALNAAKRMYKL
jgi:hypothetical protein